MGNKKHILILLAALLFISCSTKPQADPYLFLARELDKGKIVMLGESKHQDVIHYFQVVNIIDAWINIHSEQQALPSKLVLILETDSTFANAINSYLDNANDSLLKNDFIPYLTYEDMEFYYKLRKIKLRLNILNNNRTDKISFEIRGFELSGEDENLLRKTKSEMEKWFVADRDEYSSSGMIKYMDNNKDCSYLILYGGAHLEDGYANKSKWVTLDKNESYGYYLFYYLKEKYGKDKILTVLLKAEAPDFLKNNFKEYYNNNAFIIEWKDLPFDLPNNSSYEMVLFQPGIQTYPHLLGYVFSRVVINRLLIKITQLEKFLPGFQAKKFMYGKCLNSIFFITGNKFQNSGEVEKWVSDNKDYNGFERINSEQFKWDLYKVYTASLTYKDAIINLYNFGFTESDFKIPVADSSDWHNRVWPGVIEKVKFINAIGLYWIGYDDEKKIAKRYLEQYSKEKYDNPVDYLKWYRKKFYNEDF